MTYTQMIAHTEYVSRQCTGGYLEARNFSYKKELFQDFQLCLCALCRVDCAFVLFFFLCKKVAFLTMQLKLNRTLLQNVDIPE